MQWLIRTVALLTGLSLLAVGAYTTVTASSSGGAIALVIVGGLLLFSPIIFERLGRIKVGTTGLELDLTREISSLGAPETARILDRTDLAAYAEAYSFVSQDLAGDEYKAARAHLEDLLISRAAAIAQNENFDAEEVRTALRNAPRNLRVLIIGLMEGDISLVDAASLLVSLSQPLSDNEQYHALGLAIRCWYRMSDADRAAIRSAVVNNREIAQESDRWSLAQQLIRLPVSPGPKDDSETQ